MSGKWFPSLITTPVECIEILEGIVHYFAWGMMGISIEREYCASQMSNKLKMKTQNLHLLNNILTISNTDNRFTLSPILRAFWTTFKHIQKVLFSKSN